MRYPCRQTCARPTRIPPAHPARAVRPAGRRRRGAAYVLVALLTLPMLGAVALTVDLGAAQLAHARLQASSDAGTRAADARLTRAGDACASNETALQAVVQDVQDFHAGTEVFASTVATPVLHCIDGRPVVTTGLTPPRAFSAID